ncbi:hypothetical protein KM043_011033 [Ampulex compressa]|nr:hypothetical protein KM043_011033 [Ampulex compressa]
MSANKRQKISTTCDRREDNRTSYTLDTLPPEVLEMILRLLPLHDVASAVRLVSRQCRTVATTVLNGAFLAAGVRLQRTMKRIEGTIPHCRMATDLLRNIGAFHALELINAQYKLLRAVTWRYTHPPTRQKYPRLCFYGGSLLDDLNDILHRALKRPASLAGPRGVDQCVTCFVALCKRFMNFFEKVSERGINRSALVSGCKLVDLLDCLIEGREVLSFKESSKKGHKNGIVSMRLKYVMKRTWFTCLEVPIADDENSWRDRQRFMYLRLRRLVGSVNDHLFEKLHYDHDVLIQRKKLVPICTWQGPSINYPRPPPASTYSGYGEYGGQFFYYGNMNKYAYKSKFKLVDYEEATTETEEVTNAPCFDLVIGVELRCSPELAPLAAMKVLKFDDLENIDTLTSKHQGLFLRLNIMCPASMANRLPCNFTWELRSPRSALHIL